MGRFKGIKGTIILIVLIMMVVSYYFYLSNKTAANKEESTQLTVVQSLLLDNLEIQYPPSPKEVVKYYCEITKAFYNETYTEEELTDLALKIRELYDEELLANNLEDQYLIDIRTDIQSFKQKEYTISSFTTSSSTEVDYFKADGFEFAKLYCMFTLRQGTELKYSTEQFLLRKDDAGHWKIYGWDLADPDEDNHKEEEIKQKQ
ncbi:MAG: hypothetical protein PHE02_11220 [Lachnospiraceae bacterium]|nr:hypothetical protein [Lachnospiraceae bacterium]